METVKVISCEKDTQANTYIVGLSNGDVYISARPRNFGDDWVPDDVLEAQEQERAAATVGAKTGTALSSDAAPFDMLKLARGSGVLNIDMNAARFVVDPETGEVLKANGVVVESGKTLPQLVEDNATLQRGLDEANRTIEDLRRRLNLPIEIMDVTPRSLDDMHTLDRVPPHPTMPAPETVAPSNDAQDVADHLERKRQAATASSTSQEGTGS